MSVYGIVSEFNPFHKGHEYLISSARNMGAEAVVCVMSGNSTQRGELALTDKYYRARAAICGGADLVLELPYPYCSASARYFAEASLKILDDFCDTVIFGSECGDIDLLVRSAEITLTEEFEKEYASCLENGEQSAASYVSLLRKKSGIEPSSNDILGIEYIRAAKKMSSRLDFATVKRKGGAYTSSSMRDAEFASAMAIRHAMLSDGNIEKLSNQLPEGSLAVLKDAKESGLIVDTDKYLDCAQLYFRLADPTEIASFAECDGGVVERICRVANECSSGREFLEKLRTKRYTDAKLNRAILFALTGTRKCDIAKEPSYTTLLAANSIGRGLLSTKRKEEKIAVVTKPADAKNIVSDSAQRQSELCQKLSAIYTLCLKNSLPTGESVKKQPYIT